MNIKEILTPINENLVETTKLNTHNICVLNNKLQKHGLDKVTEKDVHAIATRHLFECYNEQEIINILNYFFNNPSKKRDTWTPQYKDGLIDCTKCAYFINYNNPKYKNRCELNQVTFNIECDHFYGGNKQ